MGSLSNPSICLPATLSRNRNSRSLTAASRTLPKLLGRTTVNDSSRGLQSSFAGS